MEIKIEQLVMSYGKNPILNIPELSVEKGKSYGLVGPNGAGKTTLFKCMTNIITNYDGEILINGQSVKSHNEVLLDVGIVLDGMSVYQNNTGWFNIRYFSGLRGKFDEDKTKELAGELGLLDVLSNKVNSYSYGMQKKLILLIALLHSPELLILDEPFRGLDMQTVKWFKNYLQELINQGLTLLISSHIQNDLETLCDVVYVIDQGEITEKIDIHEEQAKQIRIVNTTNNKSLKEILETLNYYFKEESNGLVLDISDERWKQVKQQLLDAEIDIEELSKIKILEKHLN